ncbi:hypothetical protein [Acinetobacter pittii]|uniref:hypothetical protein n=1 Tax=Acinetobacter pittii TaxID=48296 RepID=UPI000838118E|nr:hypothetical protein [Acinetobacter pittii]OCY53990.1 hypothetical protein BFR81_03225 [Acinetobacter pittii]
MAELSEEQSQNLRLELAKIYFKGYSDYTESKSDTATASQISSSLEQVSKSIVEIKNIISK